MLEAPTVKSPPKNNKRIIEKLIELAARRYPAIDENTTLNVNLNLVSCIISFKNNEMLN